MTRVFLFPGQGSQYKGMGAAQFQRFPELVRQADAVLGYSIEDLCLRDPRGELGQTRFTQPALYVVSVLCYLERLQQGQAEPDCLAGHSLGEWCALQAAGAFDFATGLRIVKKRGELMGQAQGGGMAAVLALELDAVEQVLAQHGQGGVSIANFNSATQTILSGVADELDALQPHFEARGARYVRLNVSAAFHSPGMEQARRAFADFLADVALLPLQKPVLSNCTARPHARTGYRPQLEAQITSPVRWYETVSSLLQLPDPQLEEIGPGMVLSKLAAEIRKKPMAGVAAPQEDASPQTMPTITAMPVQSPDGGSPHERPLPATAADAAPVVLLLGGQGGQYLGMGRALYEQQPVFRAALERCRELVQRLAGFDLLALLYGAASGPRAPFDRTLHTHPAVFSIGHAAVELVQSLGLRPELCVGYSLGEMVAGVAGGGMALDEALALVVEQARLCEAGTVPAASVMVMAGVELMQQAPECFTHCELSALNYPGSFVVVTDPGRVDDLQRSLKSMNVLSQPLPISHGFHSSRMDAIQDKFLSRASVVPTQAGRLPWVSCSTGQRIRQLTPQGMWESLRQALDLPRAMLAIPEAARAHFVDLSPSGSMGNFLKRGWQGGLRVSPLMSPFGQDLKLLEQLRQAL